MGKLEPRRCPLHSKPEPPTSVPFAIHQPGRQSAHSPSPEQPQGCSLQKASGNLPARYRTVEHTQQRPVLDRAALPLSASASDVPADGGGSYFASPHRLLSQLRQKQRKTLFPRV